MSKQYRPTVAREVAAHIALAGMLALGAAVASAAIAAADPPPEPPADPVVPAGPSAAFAPVDPNVAPPVGSFAQGIMTIPFEQLQLGQHAVPSLPGTAPALPPGDDVLTAGNYLNPLNFRMPPPDEENPYKLGEGDPDAPGTLNGIRGARGLFHGVMGKLTPEQLGEPLPGTAPHPDINVPPGLGYGLPDPGPGAPLREPVPPEGLFGAPPPQPAPPTPYG
jgi:hypothetical protein